jgi:predicted SAM-dependent methyltransferase
MKTRIHLGCGDKRLPGFINIDSRDSGCADVICDINDLPFSSGSIDLIYMCHSLEHIPMHNVGTMVAQLHSLLRLGGMIYISVPDFAVLASLYLSQRVELSSIVRAIHGGQEYPENLHYMSYDYKLLTAILATTGFTAISHYSPEVFLPYNFRDTSTYEIGGKRISLNVCATK